MIKSFVSMLMNVIKPPFNIIFAFCHTMLFVDIVVTFFHSHFHYIDFHFEGACGTKCVFVLNKSQFDSQNIHLQYSFSSKANVGYASLYRSNDVVLNNILHLIMDLSYDPKEKLLTRRIQSYQSIYKCQ